MDGHAQPFHTIVVTSPDATAAKAALQGPLDPSHLPFPQNEQRPRILSISDPFGTRVGSGGGTMNAFSEAEKSVANVNLSTNNAKGSVCIIHAGGQSSRCPTQMVLGKAWTSLPMVQNQKSFVNNPTYILMKSLSVLLKDLPYGSVVVAASDVVLQLPDSPVDFRNVPEDKVIGLAVPAPLHTAKNHGVFCLRHNAKSADMLAIQAVDQFLQKPSISDMESTGGCTFEYNNREEKMAWIDTGIVIFLPKAADGLRQLMQQDFQCCTHQGLKELFEQSILQTSDGMILDDNAPQTCEEYAKRYAKKVELYSHILLAIPTRGASCNNYKDEVLHAYLNNPSSSGLEKDLLEKIYRKMSSFELQVITVCHGKFTHLGTSVELSEFLVDCVTVKGSSSEWTHRAHTFIENLSTDSNAIIMNSLINQSSDVSIGESSILEHCEMLNCTMKIGSGCIISGWRGIWTNTVNIPDRSIFAMIPLRKKSNGISSSQYVCIFLGMQDEIKARGTFFGIPFDEVFLRTELKPNDLWNDDTIDPMVWNARLHLVITENDSIFDWTPFRWIFNLTHAANVDETSIESIRKWLTMRRLSLSEIQSQTDASLEFLFRSNLSQKISNHQYNSFRRIKQVFNERKHEEVKVGYIFDDLHFPPGCCASLEKLDLLIDIMEEIVLENFQSQSRMDICCRASMVLSIFLRDVAFIRSRLEKKSAHRNPPHPHFNVLTKFLTSGSFGVSSIFFHQLKKIIRHSVITTDIQTILQCSEEIEAIAHAITSHCTSNQIKTLSTISCDALPPLDVWVVTSAPARVDLAGGWSDTPPISYEYGGAVTNVAILVDKMKPLSSRCRRVRDLSGIILTIENRDLSSGELKEMESVHLLKVDDLLDYANPSGKCSLLKCVLFAIGLFTPSLCERETEKTINHYLADFFSDSDCTFGIELVSTSLLPHGSGLGTSSILSACLLASVVSFLGIDEGKDANWLIQKVLLVEQLLSTAGGWQDQVGGVIPGVKLCTSLRNQYPIDVSIKTLDLPQRIVDQLNRQMLLGFTGKPRLAKNILQKVLIRWALRKKEIVSTVEALVRDAHTAFQAIQDGDITSLGTYVSRYWAQKCVMAGGMDSGVEPTEVKALLDILKDSNSIIGGTLCGAGGGGFLFLILQDGMDVDSIRNVVQLHAGLDFEDGFTWHSCEVSSEGLKTFVTCENDFDFSWHRIT